MTQSKVGRIYVPQQHRDFWKRVLYGSAYGHRTFSKLLIIALGSTENLIQALYDGNKN